MLNEVMQKIESCYVGEDCIQTTMRYKKSLTIVSKDGILYHFVQGHPFHINKYLEDERRNQFPYSNISTYNYRTLLSKWKCVNQLFNFEEPYIRIVDGQLIESFALKDKHDALLIKNGLQPYESTEYKTREELEKMFEKPMEENRNLYVMRLDGTFYKEDNPLLLPSEEKIVEWTRRTLMEELEVYKKYGNIYKYNSYNYFSPYTLEFFENSINNLTIENIPENIAFTDDNILLIKTNGQDIIIQIVSIRLIKQDCYKVKITDMPITKYNLEQLKSLSPRIVTTKRPKIPFRWNPEVPKEDIHKTKKLLKMKQGR